MSDIQKYDISELAKTITCDNICLVVHRLISHYDRKYDVLHRKRNVYDDARFINGWITTITCIPLRWTTFETECLRLRHAICEYIDSYTDEELSMLKKLVIKSWR
jgi:hypothetical protein